MTEIFNINHRKRIKKQHVKLTGTLAETLKPGIPAVYLYHGQLIRTDAVRAILEASPDYVRFETTQSVYTLTYTTMPSEATA